MRRKKVCSIVAIMLVVVMGLLAGCGKIKKFDAGAYTKSCLDAMYKAEFGEYTKITKISEEEAQEDYDDNIEAIVGQFNSLGLSEELVAGYKQFFIDLLKNTKYTIKEVREDDDKNFEVDVEVEIPFSSTAVSPDKISFSSTVATVYSVFPLSDGSFSAMFMLT